MLRFELRHYMYLPPIFKPRIMSPLNRGSGLFVPVPRGSAATAAPPPGYHISPPHGAQKVGSLTLAKCKRNGLNRVFRGSQIGICGINGKR